MNADEIKLYTCCFFGHRKINETELLRNKLYNTIEDLIIDKKVNTFLFGSKSEFNSLCYEKVTELKQKYPHIKRVYVRAEYPNIDDSYKAYLLKYYDETYFPEKLLLAGRAVYVERNLEMINKSCFCVVYYNEISIPITRKSGTKIALDYAIKQKRKIIAL